MCIASSSPRLSTRGHTAPGTRTTLRSIRSRMHTCASTRRTHSAHRRRCCTARCSCTWRRPLREGSRGVGSLEAARSRRLVGHLCPQHSRPKPVARWRQSSCFLRSPHARVPTVAAASTAGEGRVADAGHSTRQIGTQRCELRPCRRSRRLWRRLKRKRVVVHSRRIYQTQTMPHRVRRRRSALSARRGAQEAPPRSARSRPLSRRRRRALRPRSRRASHWSSPPRLEESPVGGAQETGSSSSPPQPSCSSASRPWEDRRRSCGGGGEGGGDDFERQLTRCGERCGAIALATRRSVGTAGDEIGDTAVDDGQQELEPLRVVQ